MDTQMSDLCSIGRFIKVGFWAYRPYWMEKVVFFLGEVSIWPCEPNLALRVLINSQIGIPPTIQAS